MEDLLDPLRRVARLRTHIAWLGQSSRMAWWDTDVLDPDAGGAILHGLVPRTATWAAMEIAWACAAAIEQRAVTAVRTITLFGLTPSVDARLLAWLRLQKKGRNAADALIPSARDVEDRDPADVLEAWALLPEDAVRAAHAAVAVPGATALSLGTLPADALLTEDGIVAAVERLAAGYSHAGRNRAVTPFIEIV